MKWVATRASNGKENTHRSPEARSRDESGGVVGGSDGEGGGGCSDVHCPTSVSWGYVVPAIADVEHLPGCTQCSPSGYTQSSPWTFCAHALSRITPCTQSDQITAA